MSLSTAELLATRVTVATVTGIATDASSIDVQRYADGCLMLVQGADRVYVDASQINLMIAALTAAKGA